MQIRCGCIWKQLIASIADSQRTISREPGAPIQKYPQVLAGARRHPAPDPRPGAAEFRADRPLGLSGHQEEDGIAPAVRVQLAGLNERLDERRRQDHGVA